MCHQPPLSASAPRALLLCKATRWAAKPQAELLTLEKQNICCFCKDQVREAQTETWVDASSADLEQLHHLRL